MWCLLLSIPHFVALHYVFRSVRYTSRTDNTTQQRNSKKKYVSNVRTTFKLKCVRYIFYTCPYGVEYAYVPLRGICGNLPSFCSRILCPPQSQSWVSARSRG